MPGLKYDENDDGPGQIDSRHLPVEPRTKVETVYQNSAGVQRVAAIAYSPGTQKQNDNSGTNGDDGTQYSNLDDDEYLDVIRNADLAKNSQTSKAPYQTYTTGSQAAAIVDHQNNYDYTTKSPFSSSNGNNNDYKRYTTRGHSPATPSPQTVSNLQPQTSQQQFSVRQPTHYTVQPAKHVVTAAGPSPDYSQSYSDSNKDIIRVNLKKYQDSTGKTTKYDPVHGQYHHEVSAKPTKKVENFRPSYRFGNPPQLRLDQSTVQQQSVVPLQQHQSQNQQQQLQIQQQPLHYQSVQQISSGDPKSGQSQYSIVVPRPTQQALAQQAYFSSEPTNPFQSFYPHNEQLIASNFAQQTSPDTLSHLSTVPQQIENNKQPGAPSEFRIQYLHHVSPTPTPTPTPRARFVSSDSTPGQPLKYELYDPSGSVNVQKDGPKIKLISAGGLQQPQHLHRPQFADKPQYYKNINRPPTAHVQYVPIRQQQQFQLNGQSPQSPLSPQASQHYRQQATIAAQGQQDIFNVPISPSQNTLFVAPNTGKQF